MENAVYGVFDRGKPRANGTYYLHGTYNVKSTTSTGDRRPRAEAGAHGEGPVRTWLNFYEDNPDGGGNTLRAKTNPSVLRQNVDPDYSATAMRMCTAFIVSDSTFGGGNPIGDNVSFNGAIKARKGDDISSPIWAAGTTGIVTNGETRLNGTVVNGRHVGFSGGAELLSFTTTGEYPAAFFGFYGNTLERSYEQLGEIVLFSRVLVGDERDGIEAYLMNKWLGILPGGWCDWHRATVSGAGTVKAPSREVLPAFAADFTGTVALGSGSLAFHVDETDAVTDALVLPEAASLVLPAAGEVSVTFAGRPASCVLATAGDLSGFAPENWTLRVVPATAGSCRLVCADGTLRLDVFPGGTQIFIR
ncbi:MAG: hypothetical protein ACI4Q3_01345 [Kiritimatiellia bacterium]